MGPITAPTVRAFLADGHAFPDAKAAASYVGITPSNWSSGTHDAPASLANVLEVSIIDVLLHRLRALSGAEGQRGRERGYRH